MTSNILSLSTAETKSIPQRPEPCPGHPPDFDLPRIEMAVREMLLAIGEDPDREGLEDTPARVARSWGELFAGLQESPADHLSRTFQAEGDGIVALSDIEFTSVCEHHLLPVTGRAHVAYIPDGDRVVGLSKLARTVDVFARRPQLQERMTAQIADAVMEYLQPAGCLVVVEAEHSCMTMRGVKKHGSTMRTIAKRGLLADDSEASAQAMQLLGLADSR